MSARLSRIHALDAAGRRIVVAGLSEERVHRSLRRILRGNVLCSISTIAPGNRAHINTAFFALSKDLELFFLSHPRSLHCRNLATNPSMAVTVFSSDQDWTEPSLGLQFFGRCHLAERRHAEAAEWVYGQRFLPYRAWKKTLAETSPGRRYRFYRFVVSTLKIHDEREFGGGVWVVATISRRRNRWL
ncbi:MAG TPA: hypothetical protein VGR25_04375 [bacterium]|nr:hypothetical protein [bacterium]